MLLRHPRLSHNPTIGGMPVFITEGSGRYEHQFESERTYWRVVEVHAGTHVHLARTAGCGHDAPRLFLICTTKALRDALVRGAHGKIDELWSLGRIQGADPGQWGSQPVAKVLQHYADVLGGVNRLEVVLRDGDRYWVSPPVPTSNSCPPETIWEVTHPVLAHEAMQHRD